MWHTLVSSDYLESQSGDQVRSVYTFHTSQIADITITNRAGVNVSAWLTLKGMGEDNQPCSYNYKIDNDVGKENIAMLVVLKEMLEAASAYYEDTDGNIFPYDKVTYANSKTYTINYGAGIEIMLNPQTEWPVFANGYRNYLDLVKS